MNVHVEFEVSIAIAIEFENFELIMKLKIESVMKSTMKFDIELTNIY